MSSKTRNHLKSRRASEMAEIDGNLELSSLKPMFKEYKYAFLIACTLLFALGVWLLYSANHGTYVGSLTKQNQNIVGVILIAPFVLGNLWELFSMVSKYMKG
jgi:hypothetical protein